MALGTPIAGAAAYSAQNGTSVSPAYPSGILTTDAVLLFVGQKPSTANGGTVTLPDDWTLIEEITGAGGYGTTLGADTGNTNLRIYSWDNPVAGQTGTRSVTLSQNNVSWAFIVRVPTGGGTLSYGSADGSRTTAPTSGTPFSIALTDGASPTAFTAGDIAIWAMCIPTDVQTPNQFSAQDITATGAVFGTPIELNEPDSGTGTDIGGYSAWDNVDSGSSSTAPTVTVTAGGTTTNVRGPVALVRIRETAALDLNAEPDSYAITGSDATLLDNRALNLESGSYAITGVAATFAKEVMFNAESGAYSITGSAATLLDNRALNLEPGSYAIAGQAASLARELTVNAEPGAYAITGQNATFSKVITETADPGSYAITGFVATLEKQSNALELLADPGSYAVTGVSAELDIGKLLTTDPGNYAITGVATELLFGFTLVSDAGSYDVTGSSATFLRDLAFSADAGSYAVTGQTADINRGYVLNTQTGAYVVTGNSAEFVKDFVLNAESAAYDITGFNAELDKSGSFTADSGSYDIAGSPAELTKDLLLVAEPATEYVNPGYVDPGYVIQTGYYVDGFPVTFNYPRYPLPNEVLAGVLYGPNGDDYVGTYVCPPGSSKQILYIFDD